MLERTVEQRFWEKVNKNGPVMPGMTTPCWEWMANRIRDGYGHIKVQGKTVKAHRLSYQWHYGPIPENMQVCHSCDNPPCVNPAHLWLGTHLENTADKEAKGHGARYRRTYIDTRPKKEPKSTEQRFWEKVDKNGPTMPHMDSPCWVWIGRYFTNNKSFPYGAFDLPGFPRNKSVYAHRFSWELANNQPIPKGLFICHKCDNPKCINPGHLFLGTHTDNMRDMANKGRTGGIRTGKDNRNTKLTPGQVREIRLRYTSTKVSQRALAKEYGITQTAIFYILKGKNWARLP